MSKKTIDVLFRTGKYKKWQSATVTVDGNLPMSDLNTTIVRAALSEQVGQQIHEVKPQNRKS